MATVVIHTDPEVLAELRHTSQRMDAMLQMFERIVLAKGERLNSEEFARFLGIHRNTLRRRLDTDRTMPRPGKDGKWLLCEVLEWQNLNHQAHPMSARRQGRAGQ